MKVARSDFSGTIPFKFEKLVYEKKQLKEKLHCFYDYRLGWITIILPLKLRWTRFCHGQLYSFLMVMISRAVRHLLEKKRQNRPLSVDLRTSIVDEILRNGGDITMNFFGSKSATTKFASFDLSDVSVIYI